MGLKGPWLHPAWVAMAHRADREWMGFSVQHEAAQVKDLFVGEKEEEVLQGFRQEEALHLVRKASRHRVHICHACEAQRLELRMPLYSLEDVPAPSPIPLVACDPKKHEEAFHGLRPQQGESVSRLHVHGLKLPLSIRVPGGSSAVRCCPRGAFGMEGYDLGCEACRGVPVHHRTGVGEAPGELEVVAQRLLWMSPETVHPA
mmetsp:Transcript_109994/g.245847  ORF Transcript_109994/g.245847 Transcript_109994/m.245847 type:complete len:202 (+) Transcript_109994:1-606(+)